MTWPSLRPFLHKRYSKRVIYQTLGFYLEIKTSLFWRLWRVLSHAMFLLQTSLVPKSLAFPALVSLLPCHASVWMAQVSPAGQVTSVCRLPHGSCSPWAPWGSLRSALPLQYLLHAAAGSSPKPSRCIGAVTSLLYGSISISRLKALAFFSVSLFFLFCLHKRKVDKL